MSFELDYALAILPKLLAAAVVSIQATVGGFLLALVVGLLLALARLSTVRWLSRLAAAYIQFVRSTPLLIQLYFVFFVLPEYGIRFEPLTTGILALGLHIGSYTAEVYRAGIEGLPRGQWDAALALRFSPWYTWTRIILPQAVPPMIPVLGNYLIGMFKDSAILATISVAELLGTALNEASRSFRYLEPLILVGLIFLVLSLAASALLRITEAKVAPR